MGCPSSCEIGENLVFSICTHDPDTGVLTDADAAPTYRVYEDETGTAILSDVMAKLDDGNTTGFYTELIAVTTANGFEAGKTYTIYIEATVDSDKGGICYGFKATNIRTSVEAILADTAVIGTPVVNPTLIASIEGVGSILDHVSSLGCEVKGVMTGAIGAASFAAGAINAAAIAANAIDAATFADDVDAEVATWIWNAATASYGTSGSYGEALEAAGGGGGGDATEAKQDAMIATLATISDYVDCLPASWVTVPTVAQIWTTQLTEAYSAVTVAPTASQALFELLAMRNTQIVDTTRTAYKLDGTTEAMTLTLSLDSDGKPYKQNRAS